MCWLRLPNICVDSMSPNDTSTWGSSLHPQSKGFDKDRTRELARVSESLFASELMVANTTVQQTLTMSKVFGVGISAQALWDGQILNDFQNHWTHLFILMLLLYTYLCLEDINGWLLLEFSVHLLINRFIYLKWYVTVKSIHIFAANPRSHIQTLIWPH